MSDTFSNRIRQNWPVVCSLTLGIVCLGSSAIASETGAGLRLDDALRLTLSRQPGILLAIEERRAAAGSLDAVAGRFDPLLLSSWTRSRQSDPVLPGEGPPGLDRLQTDLTTFRISAGTFMRTGQTVTLSTDTTLLEENPGAPGVNRGRVFLTLAQPLLRGRGTAATAAEERSARLDLAAANHDLAHTVSQSVLRTTQEYWNYVAATRNLDIAAGSLARGEQLESESLQLIKADRMPAADIKQITASVAERRRALTQAEQTLRQARHNVGLAAGLAPESFDTLPLPSDDFPRWTEVLRHALDVERLTRLAFESRTDFQSARRRLESAEALGEGARNAVKPRLDLSLGAGFIGAEQAGGLGPYVSGLASNRQGPTVSTGVSFEWPTANRTALGVAAQVDALRRQSQIVLDDLTRNIRSQVALAVTDVLSRAVQAKTAHEAVVLYRSAIEDERQKLRMGVSTVIDLVLTEDRYTRSLLDEALAGAAYGSAVARLRFVTGRLVSGDETAGYSFEAKSLEGLDR